MKFTPKMYGKRNNNPLIKPFLESTLQQDNANVNHEASDAQSSPMLMHMHYFMQLVDRRLRGAALFPTQGKVVSSCLTRL